MAETKGLEPSTSGVTGRRSKPTELRLRELFKYYTSLTKLAILLFKIITFLTKLINKDNK